MAIQGLRDQRKAYEVPCPFCGAEQWQPCHYKDKPEQTVGVPHSARTDAWAVKHWGDDARTD